MRYSVITQITFVHHWDLPFVLDGWAGLFRLRFLARWTSAKIMISNQQLKRLIAVRNCARLAVTESRSV